MSSNYGFNNESLLNHKISNYSVCIAAQEAMAEVTKNYQYLAESDAIQGNAADKIKSYYTNVYPALFCLLSATLECFYNSYTEFYGAYHQIDNAENAKMTTDSLDDVSAKLDSIIQYALSVENAYLTELRKYKKAVSFTKHSGGPILSINTDDIQEIKTDIDDIIAGITDIEDHFSQTVPAVLDPFLSKIESLIENLMDQKAKDFSLTQFQNDIEKSGLISDYNLIVGNNQLMRDDVETIDKDFFALIEKRQQELKERQEKAERWGTAVDVFCFVVDVGTIIFAPAAAPVMLAVTGAIKGFKNEVSQQYVETGAILGNSEQIVSAIFSTGKGAALGYIEGKIIYNSYLKSTSAVASGYTVKVAGKDIIKVSIPTWTQFTTAVGEDLLYKTAKTVTGMTIDLTESAIISYIKGDSAIFVEDFRNEVKEAGKDSIKNISSAVFSNLDVLIPTKKLPTWGKTTVKITTDTVGGISEGIVSSLVDGEKITGSSILETGSSSLFKSVIKQSGSYVLSDKSKIGKWIADPYGSKAKQKVVSALIGAGEEYLKDNGSKAFGKVVIGDYSGAESALSEDAHKSIIKGTMQGYKKADDLQLEASIKEKSKIEMQLYQQMNRKMKIPQKNGTWSDPNEPGNSTWMLDPDGVYTVNGEELTTEEIKARYGIDSITYKDNDPVFTVVMDEVIGEVTVENMPSERTGKEGSYELFYEAAAKKLGLNDPKIIKDYMTLKGLTPHESADGRTMIAVPTEINAVFPHAGGIAVKKYMNKLSTRIEEEYNLSKGYTLVKKDNMFNGSDIDIGTWKR